jgi:hypothetical protein
MFHRLLTPVWLLAVLSVVGLASSVLTGCERTINDDSGRLHDSIR